MNRRGFLGAILAAAVAPAIVRADALMRVIPTDMAFDAELGLGDVFTVEEFWNPTPYRVDMLYGSKLLTPPLIAREALKILNNQLTILRSVNHGVEEQYQAAGSRIVARRPARALG